METHFVAPNISFYRPSVEAQAKPLTLTELDALLDHLDPARPIKYRGGATKAPTPDSTIYQMRQQNLDLIMLLYNTGCRIGELQNLKWAQVEKDFSALTFFRTKTRKKVKTGAAATGLYPCPPHIREMLARRREETKGLNYVFPGWQQKQVDGKRTWLREDKRMGKLKAVYRAFEELGFNSPENVRLYGRRCPKNMRDTFATIQLSGDVPLDHVQKMLGHTTSKMTQKYTAYAMDDIWGSANKVTEALEAQRRAQQQGGIQG